MTGAAKLYLTATTYFGKIPIDLVAEIGAAGFDGSWVLSGIAGLPDGGFSLADLIRDLARETGLGPSDGGFPVDVLPGDARLSSLALRLAAETIRSGDGERTRKTDSIVANAYVGARKSEAEPNFQLLALYEAETEKPAQAGGSSHAGADAGMAPKVVVGAAYTAPIELPEAPKILQGLFAHLSIRQVLVAYSSDAVEDLLIPGVQTIDVETGSIRTVTDNRKVTLDKGLSFLATLDAQGSSEEMRLTIGGNAALTGHTALAERASEDRPFSKWFEIDKRFGPLAIQRIGVTYAKSDDQLLVGMLFDASIHVASFTLGLLGLSVTVPLEKLFQNPREIIGSVDIGLSGLALAYSSGGVAISGALIKGTVGGVTVYSGQASLKFGTFAVDALASYALLGDKPSLFVFALVSIPLGDPTATGAFYVTGVAAGFGYNRRLELPAKDAVAKYPLVRGAVETDPDPQEIIKDLDRYIAPEVGQNWLAAGVRFTSWEILKSFALLTVAFGNELEIGLLGVSTLRVPPGSPEPVAQAELGLVVQLIPARGVLSAAAELSPSSYVLSKKCRLTGGFAFNYWFGGHQHAGDFVATLGGYSPRYEVPAWYPSEPRIGFRWVEDAVTLSGGCYFALVPHAVMAGGALSVVYQQGRLRASLVMFTDFILEWKPFHYQLRLGVAIDASYRAGFPVSSTLRLHAQADLEIWGPPFAGRAHVEWFVISFTVEFGAVGGSNTPPPLTWPQFQTSFLPQASGSATEADLLDRRGNATGLKNDANTAAVSVTITEGILRQKRQEDSAEVEYTLVNAYDLTLVTSSVLPSTRVTVQGVPIEMPAGTNLEVHVRPMKDPSLLLRSTHAITIGKKKVELDESPEAVQISTTIALDNAPAALWGKPTGKDDPPVLNPKDGGVVKNVVLGTTLTLVPPRQPEGVGPFPFSRLEHNAPAYHPLAWGHFESSSAFGWDQNQAIKELARTIMESDIERLRSRIAEELIRAGLPVGNDIDLEGFRLYAGQILFDRPILSRLGDLPPQRSQEVGR